MSSKHQHSHGNSKTRPPAQERRYLDNGELRVKSDSSGKQKIAGYATKFGVLSEDLGGFREQIDPHAFDACLAANPDVRGLWNHDANHILGSTTAGTLRLSVDSTGLHYEIDPPNTSMAKDLMVSMQRGDVTQSSFGFICTDDSWEDSQGGLIRTVRQAQLFDVSPVTFPAYPDATSGVRARDALRTCPLHLRDKVKLTKKVDGEHLPASAFIIVGDPTDTGTWFLPWKFSTEAKIKSHLRDALARFDQLKGQSKSVLKTAWQKLLRLCEQYGIQVSDADKNKQFNSSPTTKSRRDDDDGNCDPDFDADCDPYDTDGDDDDDDDSLDDCECSCSACQAGECFRCSNATCDERACLECPAQTTRAHQALLLLRLR